MLKRGNKVTKALSLLWPCAYYLPEAIFPGGESTHLNPRLKSQSQQVIKDNTNIDTVISTMNVIRETFYTLNSPVIVWVNDYIMGRFIKVAPDFYNCSGTINLSNN